MFVVSLSFLSLPSHSLFFISGIIASDWSCDSGAFVSSVMWLYDLQETEWVWCDGNNPDSLCDWATEGCHMPSMMRWMRGKIPARTSVAAPPCSLIAHWIRFHCVYLLVCECSCSVCVCWRSMAVAAFLSIEIWSRNVSLTDYPQCFSPTQGSRLARRLECVCVYVRVLEVNSAEVRFILPEGWTASVEGCGCFWRAVLSVFAAAGVGLD